MRRIDRPLRDLAERYGLQWHAGESHSAVGERLLNAIQNAATQQIEEASERAETERNEIVTTCKDDTDACVSAVSAGLAARVARQKGRK